jgi:hypothetical protein
MRGRLLLVAAVALAACGPSSGEIKRAKTAVYTCEPDQIVRAARDVIGEETPPVGVVDPEHGLVASDFRWHSASGMRKKSGAAVREEGDLGFIVEVAIGKVEGGYRILVRPHIYSQSPDSPRGREMSREDANWPGWADGKADTVQLQIHDKLSACAAKGAG